jgi:hypothetical protein
MAFPPLCVPGIFYHKDLSSQRYAAGLNSAGQNFVIGIGGMVQIFSRQCFMYFSQLGFITVHSHYTAAFPESLRAISVPALPGLMMAVFTNSHPRLSSLKALM